MGAKKYMVVDTAGRQRFGPRSMEACAQYCQGEYRNGVGRENLKIVAVTEIQEVDA